MNLRKEVIIMDNNNPKWNLKEYTSEFILDGSNQFVFTLPILLIPVIEAFSGKPQLLIAYFLLLTFFFVFFYFLVNIRIDSLFAHRKKKIPWAFRPLPQANTSSLPRFLKDYGFGSTAVFLSILVPMAYFTFIDFTDPGPGKQSAFWFVFICVVGWDTGIYTFSMLAGFERHYNAWKRDRLTKNMNRSEYDRFLRNEYLAEKGRAAGFNDGYMVGRNSRH